nr:hypothetical protein CFP56_10067 [Quercus suber]
MPSTVNWSNNKAPHRVQTPARRSLVTGVRTTLQRSQQTGQGTKSIDYTLGIRTVFAGVSTLQGQRRNESTRREHTMAWRDANAVKLEGTS